MEKVRTESQQTFIKELSKILNRMADGYIVVDGYGSYLSVNSLIEFIENDMVDRRDADGSRTFSNLYKKWLNFLLNGKRFHIFNSEWNRLLTVGDWRNKSKLELYKLDWEYIIVYDSDSKQPIKDRFRTFTWKNNDKLTT